MPSSPGNGGRAVVFAPKFRLPALRAGLVERPRLTELLAESDGRLTLLAAPPGFGKSTLLAQWAAADPRAFAFVSLEPSENDPVVLWNCVVGSVRQVAPSFGSSVEPMLQSVGGIVVGPLVRRIAVELDQLSEPRTPKPWRCAQSSRHRLSPHSPRGALVQRCPVSR